MKTNAFGQVFLIFSLLLLLAYGINYALDFDGGEVMAPTIAKGLLSFWDYPRSTDSILAEYYNENESLEGRVAHVKWGPLLPYLIAISFKIFGISNFTARLPSIFFGFGIVVLSYFFCEKILKNNLGYLTILLLMSSPMFLVYSNNASLDVPMGFFLMASTYCLAYYLKTNRSKYVVLSSLALGVGFWIKYTLVLTMLPNLLFLNRKKMAYLFICLFLLMASALALYFTYTNGFEDTKETLIRQAMRYFENNGLFYRSSSYEVITQFLRFAYPLVLLSAIGFFVLIKNRKKYQAYAAHLPFLLFALLLVGSTKTLRHFVVTLPFFAILASVGLRHIIRLKLYALALLFLLLHLQVFIDNRNFMFNRDTQYTQLAPLFDKQFKLMGCDTRSIGYYANMEYYFSGKMRPGDFFNILSKDKKARYVVFCDYEGEFPRLDPKEISEIKGYVTSRCKQMMDKRITRGLSIFDCKEG